MVIAMLFQCVATMAASWCEHADGSRRIEMPAVHLDCHDDADDPIPEGPLLDACSDDRVVASPAIVQPGIPRPFQHPMAVISLLDWNGLEPALRAGLRSDTQIPPNTPLLSICTVILLI